MSETRTYILILYLPVDTLLEIGSLGEFDFPAGFYAYAGSVTEPETLTERLKHHLSPINIPESHIDYLQQVTSVEEIWLSSISLPRRDAWAELLLDIPDSVAFVEGFGTPDDEWDTYLVYFDMRPALEDFAIGVRKRFPDDIVLRAFSRGEEPADDEVDP